MGAGLSAGSLSRHMQPNSSQNLYPLQECRQYEHSPAPHPGPHNGLCDPRACDAFPEPQFICLQKWGFTDSITYLRSEKLLVVKILLTLYIH